MNGCEKPMPSDEDATSAERLSLVSESNTTELQQNPKEKQDRRDVSSDARILERAI